MHYMAPSHGAAARVGATAPRGVVQSLLQIAERAWQLEAPHELAPLLLPWCRDSNRNNTTEVGARGDWGEGGRGKEETEAVVRAMLQPETVRAGVGTTFDPNCKPSSLTDCAITDPAK